MAIFIRICRTARIPCLAVHDSDMRPRRRPTPAKRGLNAEIARLAGPGRAVMLTPDFQAVARLQSHHHKPARGSDSPRSSQTLSPNELRRVVALVVELARSDRAAAEARRERLERRKRAVATPQYAVDLRAYPALIVPVPVTVWVRFGGLPP